MNTPISVIIIAKNEESRIKECLDSIVGWAGEIILVDDGSTDQTCAIASQYDVKILHRRMDQEGKHRNFGADQAKNEWVMMLDCDERLTPELKQEIDEALAQRDEKVMGFWAPKANFIGPVQLKYGGWSNPRLKVYHRKFVRWSEAPHDVVHPGIKVADGYRGITLTQPFIHYDCRNLEDFIRKINRYSTLEAVKWHMSGRKMTFGKMLWRAVDRFFRRYVGRKGYKDGYYGFVGAVLGSFHEFAAYSKLREIKEHGTYIQ